MTEPLGAPAIPSALEARYREWHWDVAWHFHARSIVYRVSRGPDEVRFIKLTEAGWHPSLAAEAERIAWAGGYLPVPEVLTLGSDADVDWLVTAALPGLDATHPSHRADTAELVRIAARGLRDFHRAPVDECPFDFRLDAALASARARVEDGVVDTARDFHDEFAHLTPTEAIDRLERARPDSEDLVVCHGDYCLPNVLISDGRTTGFVDLGELGVADRWWDLAVGTWSLGWNLGPGYEELFLAEYGADLDQERLAFYRLLYDLVS